MPINIPGLSPAGAAYLNYGVNTGYGGINPIYGCNNPSLINAIANRQANDVTNRGNSLSYKASLADTLGSLLGTGVSSYLGADASKFNSLASALASMYGSQQGAQSAAMQSYYPSATQLMLAPLQYQQQVDTAELSANAARDAAAMQAQALLSQSKLEDERKRQGLNALLGFAGNAMTGYSQPNLSSIRTNYGAGVNFT